MVEARWDTLRQIERYYLSEYRDSIYARGKYESKKIMGSSYFHNTSGDIVQIYLNATSNTANTNTTHNNNNKKEDDITPENNDNDSDSDNDNDMFDHPPLPLPTMTTPTALSSATTTPIIERE